MDLDLIFEQVQETNQYPLTPEECIPKEDAKKLTNLGDLIVFPEKIRINPYGTGEKYLKFLLKKDSEERSNMAKLTGDILPVSCGYNYENKMYVTPYGGPTLTEGEKVPNSEGNLIIDKIHYNDTIQQYILEIRRV